MNINSFIFTRTAPAKKLEVIKGLTQEEVLAITADTIKRLVKETGRNRNKSRDKEIYIPQELGAYNGWDSWVEHISLYKGKLYVDFYVQLNSFDYNKSYPISDFLKHGKFTGFTTRADRYGNPQTYYFHYYNEDKTKVWRAVLMQYVQNKYQDKLNGNGKKD